MSLPLEFRAASGHTFSPLSTLDSRGLGSRPVHKDEVPNRPTPAPDLALAKPSTVQSPSSTQPLPPRPVQHPARHLSERHLLPPAMTDLKLCMGPSMMPLTTFSYFVDPEPLQFEGPQQFHRFMDLAPKIRRIIFEHCDTPTLFHLMHTSSYTRHECVKLFWEPEDNTWYRVFDAHTMFQDHKVIMIYPCPEFASRVTQVEIDIDYLLWNQVPFSGQRGLG